jgi:hypothetical protein
MKARANIVKTVTKMLLCLARIAVILVLLSYMQMTRKSDIADMTTEPQGILCGEHPYFLQNLRRFGDKQ